MRQRLLCGVTACLGAMFGTAFGEASVEGTLMINGQTVKLAHAYVYYHMNEEKMMDSQEIRVLLTDNEIPVALLARPVLTRLDSLAREGVFKGVLLRYDPIASEREVHGTIYFKPEDPRMSMPFFSLAGENDGFTSLSFMPSEMSAEIEGNNDESQFEDMPKYAYQASFTAPVTEGPEITGSHEGKAAAATPQAQAALDFEKAVRAGKLDEAKKLCTAARVKDMEAFINQVGEETFKQQASQFIPDPAVRAQQVKNVYVRGDYAMVIFDEDGGTTTVDVIKDGDAWKLD